MHPFEPWVYYNINIATRNAIDPIHAAKYWNNASFSWIKRHTEGDRTIMLHHGNMK